MTTTDTPAVTSIQGLVTPEQALNRQDRPLVHQGLDWTWTQCLYAGVPAALIVVWSAVWVALLTLTARHLTVGGALLVSPWLLGPVGALAYIGRQGVVYNREGVQPLQRQRLAYRWRTLRDGRHHHYRPYPDAEGAYARVRYRHAALPARIARARGRALSVPLPYRPTAPIGRAVARLSAPDGEGAGLLRRADGVWVAYLDIGPIIPRGRPGLQAALFALNRELLRGLQPGRTIQMLVDNRSTDVDGVNDLLDGLARSRGAPQRAMRRARRDWLAAEYRGSYAAQATYTLSMDDPDPAVLMQRRADVVKTLGAMGLRVQAPTPAQVATRVAALTSGRAWEMSVEEAPTFLTLTTSASDDARVLRRTLTIGDWPAHIAPEQLFALPLLPVRSQLAYTFTGLDQQAAARMLHDRAEYMRNSDLNKRRKKAAAGTGAAGGGSGVVVINPDEGDLGLQADARELSAAYWDVRRGASHLLDVTLTLTVLTDDVAALDTATDVAYRALYNAGFPVWRGTYDQLPLYRLAQPTAAPAPRAHRLLATTTTAGVLLPFVTDTPGHALAGDACSLLGRSEVGGQMVFFRWKAAATQAILFLGDQGMGKSSGMGILIDDSCQRDEYVTILDPVGSFISLVRDIYGGTVVELLAPGVSVNLLELLPDAYDNPVVAALDVCSALMGHDDGSLEGWQLSALERGLRWMYAEARRRAARGWIGTPRLRYLVIWLRRQECLAAGGGYALEARQYRALYQTLAPYYGAGTFASLMDKTTNVDTTARRLIVDTRQFAKQRGSIAGVGLQVATTLADLRARHAAAQGVAHRTFLDEMYGVLRLALRWVAGVGRTIRHDNNSVAGASHKLRDVVALPEAETIMTAIKTWVMVCMQEDVEILHKHLGLPLPVCERVRTLTRTEDRAQALFYTKTAEQGTAQFGFMDIKLYPALKFVLGTYADEKTAKAALAKRRGGMLKAALATGATAREERTAV